MCRHRGEGLKILDFTESKGELMKILIILEYFIRHLIGLSFVLKASVVSPHKRLPTIFDNKSLKTLYSNMVLYIFKGFFMYIMSYDLYNYSLKYTEQILLLVSSKNIEQRRCLMAFHRRTYIFKLLGQNFTDICICKYLWYTVGIR